MLYIVKQRSFAATFVNGHEAAPYPQYVVWWKVNKIAMMYKIMQNTFISAGIIL